ncbi:MAG TPA: outer membrane protein assembly factor BamB [Macromonas sp.]|nr:outer membrane protein assembly factor BamB [Macromonas sp.]
MKATVHNPLLPAWCKWSVVALAIGLSACSFGSKKPEPAPLLAVTAQIPAKQVWRTQIGDVSPLLTPTVKGNALFVANAAGTVFQLNTDTGRQSWRLDLGVPLAAGVGSDGETAAVVTRDNELVAVAAGKEVWRTRIPARVFTTPLVAGQRVFVLAADRSVHAFDGKTGARLWSQPSRGGDALVLQQAGVLLAVGDTLITGNGGRLTGINPSNGSQRWSAAIANPRGTNEVERLVDLVGHVGRVDDTVCARAFQSAVGCVDAARGVLLWAKPGVGGVGVHADEDQMYGIEGNDRVVAWKRSSGEQVWSNEKFSYRGLTAPLAAGRSIAIGDAQGYVHLLSRTDGNLLNRLTTDGSAVVYAPVLAGRTLVAVTREGGVFGWRPE